MIKTSFTLCLFLSKIIIPKPELTNNPPSKAPNDNELDIYNSVIRMLEAQLGISPMIDENNGDKYLLVTKKLVKLSFPTASTMRPKPKLITKTYKKISKEWNNG